MNLLDQLIRQLNILIKIVDELSKSIKMALNKEYLSEIQLNVLNEAVKITLNVSKSFIENYNEFLSEIDIEESQIE